MGSELLSYRPAIVPFPASLALAVVGPPGFYADSDESDRGEELEHRMYCTVSPVGVCPTQKMCEKKGQL